MTTMVKKAMLAGLIGFALVACGKKDEGSASTTSTTSTTSAAAKVGSCQKLTNAGKCTEYSLKDEFVATISKGGCEATEGKWQLTACPADKQFANCATSDSKIVYYAGTQTPGSAFTVDEEFAKLDCDLMSGKLAITGKATVPTSTAAAAPAAPVKKAAPPKGKK